MPNTKPNCPTKVSPKAKGMGRPKGSKNKIPVLLKHAIMLAAEQVGQDGTGKDGLVGYCRFLAQAEPKAFAALMGRVLPLEVVGAGGAPLSIEIKTIYEDRPAKPPMVIDGVIDA